MHLDIKARKMELTIHSLSKQPLFLPIDASSMYGNEEIVAASSIKSKFAVENGFNASFPKRSRRRNAFPDVSNEIEVNAHAWILY